MDTARRLRLWRLLDAEGHRYLDRWDELAYLLAPFVATNEAEQRLFYQIFADFQAQCGTWNPPPPPPPPIPWWRRYGVALVASLLGLLLLLAVAWWQTTRPVPPLLLQVERLTKAPARAGQPLPLRHTTPASDSSGFRWAVYDATTGAALHQSVGYELDWIPTQAGQQLELRLIAPLGTNPAYQPDSLSLPLTIHCALPPVLDPQAVSPSDGELLVQDSLIRFAVGRILAPGEEARWVFAGKDTAYGAAVSHAFAGSDGEVGVQLRLSNDSLCYQEASFRYRLGANLPMVSLLPLRLDQPQASHRYGWWYWFWVLLPLLALPPLLVHWYRRFRPRPLRQRSEAELAAAFPVHDAAPYELPYQNQAGRIHLPPAFFRLAAVLRRREAGLRRVFDAAASIGATVAAGGYPNWRDRALTRPAAYLLLLPYHEGRHQQDRLLRWLADFWQQQDAPVAVYFHRGDFRQVWSLQGEESLSLTQLHRQYPRHRLLLMGDAHGLVNPYASERPSLIQAPLRELLRWEQRLLLSTEAAADWSWQEQLLAAHFPLYPATTAGMLAGLEALDQQEEYLPGSFERWAEEARRRFPEAPARYCRWDRLEDLRAYCAQDPDLFRWLCGLAVSAKPDWDLSIAIGQALGLAVTHDRLLQLSRIPWLAQNAPPQDLRLALLGELDPADTRLARAAVIAELEAVQELVQGGLAQSEWTADLAVQRFALDPQGAAPRQLVRDLREAGLLSLEQEDELDFVLREGAAQGSLPAVAGKGLETWLEQPQRGPWYSWSLGLAALLLLLSLGMGSYGLWYNQQAPAGPAQNALQETLPVSSEAIALHNAALRIAQRRDSLDAWTSWQAGEDSLLYALDLLRQARQLQVPYPLADSHYLALHFNQAARAFHFFLADSAAIYPSLQLSSDTLNQAWPPANHPRALAWLHLRGLKAYYQHRDSSLDTGAAALDTARAIYASLLSLSEGRFFDSLRQVMPVNLATLLAVIETGEEVLPNPLESYRLTGRLRHAGTGGALGNVTLRWPQGETSTGASGDFTLAVEALSGSSLRLTARHPGFAPLDTLLSLPPPGPLSLVMRPQTLAAFSLSGQVLDEQGQPLAGARLRFKGQAVDTTDAQGGFAFDYLPQNDTDIQGLLSVEATGYRVSERTVELPLSAPLSLRLQKEDIPPVGLPKMIRIPGGSFLMGSPQGEGDNDERPEHEVTVSTFQMAETEVTVAQYLAFCQATDTHWPEWLEEGNDYHVETGTDSYYKDKGYAREGGESLPVVGVSWNNAVAYCHWVSEQTGQGYRLPTEAEWEYAAGGGLVDRDAAGKRKYEYAGGSDLDALGWYSANSNSRPQTVAQKQPNGLGLYDMSGNVWEWCSDWYGDYPSEAQVDPRGPDSGSNRVFRGGSWINDAEGCRTAYRDGSTPGYRAGIVGFRPVFVP